MHSSLETSAFLHQKIEIEGITKQYNETDLTKVDKCIWNGGKMVKKREIVCLFVSSVFNGTFSTNRLY